MEDEVIKEKMRFLFDLIYLHIMTTGCKAEQDIVKRMKERWDILNMSGEQK